jgi:hypothetical protein
MVSLRKWEKLIAISTAKTTPSGPTTGLVSTLVLLLIIIPLAIRSLLRPHAAPARWPHIPLYPYLPAQFGGIAGAAWKPRSL